MPEALLSRVWNRVLWDGTPQLTHPVLALKTNYTMTVATLSQPSWLHGLSVDLQLFLHQVSFGILLGLPTLPATTWQCNVSMQCNV